MRDYPESWGEPQSESDVAACLQLIDLTRTVEELEALRARWTRDNQMGERDVAILDRAAEIALEAHRDCARETLDQQQKDWTGWLLWGRKHGQPLKQCAKRFKDKWGVWPDERNLRHVPAYKSSDWQKMPQEVYRWLRKKGG